MRKAPILLALAAVIGLAACDNDIERGAGGAAAGALLANATGYNMVGGAVAGAAAGVFCDDVGICR